MKNQELLSRLTPSFAIVILFLCSIFASCENFGECTEQLEGRVLTYSEEEGVPYSSDGFLSEAIGKADVNLQLRKVKSTCCPVVHETTYLGEAYSDTEGYFDFGQRICDDFHRITPVIGEKYKVNWYDHGEFYRRVLIYEHKSLRINFLTQQNDLAREELRYIVKHQNGDLAPFSLSSNFFKKLTRDTLSVSVMPNCNLRIDLKYKGIEQTHLFYSGDLYDDKIIDITLIE